MRLTDGDLGRGCEVKMEWFSHVKPDLIINDDPEVVEAAIKEDFTVLQIHGFRETGVELVPSTT